MFRYFSEGANPFSPNWQEQMRKREILSSLIGVNILVFLLVNVASVLFFFAGADRNLLEVGLSVPSNFEVLCYRPWGIFTYMFTHSGFFHLLFNMIWLYWSGSLFVKYFDRQKLLRLYVLGGIGGAVLYVLLYNTLPAFAFENRLSYAVGASASVMAIFFAVAVYEPTRPIYLFILGKLQIQHLAIGVIVIDLISMPNGNAGGHISHLGGALVGVVFGLLSKRFSVEQNLFRAKNYKHSEDFVYNTEKKQEKDRINAILDKISKSGYESLTAEERKILFKSSYKK